MRRPGSTLTLQDDNNADDIAGHVVVLVILAILVESVDMSVNVSNGRIHGC
jgi:hypothetical protein